MADDNHEVVRRGDIPCRDQLVPKWGFSISLLGTGNALCILNWFTLLLIKDLLHHSLSLLFLVLEPGGVTSFGGSLLLLGRFGFYMKWGFLLPSSSLC